MTDHDLDALKRRHEAGMDTLASAHADRGALLAEVERLNATIAALKEREEWLMKAVEDEQNGRGNDREAVVMYLRAKAGHYAPSLWYAALIESANTISSVGYPLCVTLPKTRL